MRRAMIVMGTALALVVGGCAGDATESDEYQELQDELLAVQAQLSETTADLEAAQANLAATTTRHDASLETTALQREVLDDPGAYGTEDEVVDLLASRATDDAVMDDAVFGAVPMRQAWHNTLYGGAMDARIDAYDTWVSEDGSQGGALWQWYGTNEAGNYFELAGISLDEYDENGLLAYEYVVYPYSDDYVTEAVSGSGTARTLEEESSLPVEDAFVFGGDDLCEWVTEDDVTSFARDAYEAVGVEWDGNAVLTEQHWVEDGIEFECQWRLSALSGSGFEGLVLAETWPVSAQATNELVGYEDLTTTYIPIGTTVSGHPEFADDVLISNNAFGRYGFWVPTSDDQLVISVNIAVDDDALDWEVPLFIIANGFLEGMNWAS